MDLNRHIQTKSSTSKARYAFGVALAVTLVIGFVWSTTLSARFSSLTGTKDVNEKKEETSKTFTEIFDEAKSQVGAIADWDTEIQEGVQTNNLDSLNTFSDSESNESVHEEVSVDVVQKDTVPTQAEINEAETNTEDDGVTVQENSQELAEPRTVLIGIKKTEPVNPDSSPENTTE